MSWPRHLVFAAAYIAAALAVAFALPLAVGTIAPSTGALFGLIVFALGALLHEVWSRLDEQDRTTHRLWRLKEQQEEIRTLLLHLERRLSANTPGGELGAVVSEARMLQKLAEQLPPQGPLRPAYAAARSASPMPTDPIHPAETVPVDSSPMSASTADMSMAAASASRLSTPRPLAGERPPARPLTAAFEIRSTDDDAVLETIRSALRSDRVDIFLQPICSLPQRKHRYYEVFSRIRDEDGTHLLPETYLPVAERAGLIAAIDNLLLFRCIQLIRETEKRHQNVGFFCNISAATLNDATFMTEFVQYMGQNPNLRSKLVFELAQNDLMQGNVFATGFLDGLRRLGFHFSMDQVDRLEVDWDQLAQHEIRFVKLDAARLLDPDGRFAAPDSVRKLKSQMDRNNIDLIVEKIETDQQLLELLDLYIDFGQGYLFGEPRLARRQS